MDVDEGTPHVTASPTHPPSPVEDGQSRAHKPPKDFVRLDAVTASGIEQAIRKMHRAYAALRVKTDVQKRERAYTIFAQGEGQRIASINAASTSTAQFTSRSRRPKRYIAKMPLRQGNRRTLLDIQVRAGAHRTLTAEGPLRTRCSCKL